MKFKGKVYQLIQGYFSDSLFRNSFYLMLGTAILAGFGFFFWVISARLFLTYDIGLATTLISVMNLIALLSLIGFDAAFIRFLPTSQQKNEKMNTGIILVTIVSIILALIFLGSVNVVSPRLLFVRDNPMFIVIFIFACIMNSLNVLTDSVFLAGRQTKYTLGINIIFSVVKLVFPFAFISFGAMGIFIAATFAQTLGAVLSFGVMVWKFDFRPTFKIDMGVLSLVWRYSTTNYVAGAINLLPPAIIPILITDSIGATASAYYYMVMMIGNMLYTIPWSTAKSLFAEGSHDEETLSKNIKQSIKTALLLLVPSMIILFAGGSKLLAVFGKDYANGGGNFLHLVTLCAIPITINAIFGIYIRVKKNLKAVLIINVIYTTSIITLSYLFIPLGLPGIGFALVIGNAISAIMSYTIYTMQSQREPFLKHIDNVAYDLFVVSKYNALNLLVSLKNGFKRKTILFYPDKPEYFHTLYKIVNQMGYKITNDPNAHFDGVIAFEDTTVRKSYPVLEALHKKGKVINYGCGDISKERVEKIFKEVFGYGTAVDPVTFKGECVRKSSANGVHDGKVIQCPTKPEKGYIYQKLVNNVYGGKVVDIRLPIVGDTIPYVCERYKELKDRFDNTLFSTLFEVNEKLTKEEIAKVLKFTKKFGLDFGEIDTIRDNKNGKLYIVDVNNTATGPRPGRHISKDQYNKIYLKRLEEGLAHELFS